MNSKLKRKYTTYNGDIQIGSMWKAAGVQYGHIRTGNGNGKRPQPTHVTDDFKNSAGKAAKGLVITPKVMVIDGLTGHRVMVAQ